MRFEEQTEIDERVFEKVRSIRKSKGQEYATVEDTLADFKEVAEETGVSPLQVWNVYVKKHVRAIDTFVREGEVKSETIEGRIVDVIVYHLLLLGLIEDLDVGTFPRPEEPRVPMAHRGPPQDVSPGVAERQDSSTRHRCGSQYKPNPDEPNHTLQCSRDEGHVGQHESSYRGVGVYW